MKNTEQILDLIINNIKDMYKANEYKALNENIILYQETLNTYSQYIDLEHYSYLKSLSYKLSDENLVIVISCGESKSSRLILNSINILNSIIKNYKDRTFSKEVLLNVFDSNECQSLHSNKAKEMLKYSIENNILVLINGDVHRRIGKTTELIKMANNLCCSLVVANSTSEQYCYQLIENKIKKDCDIIKGSSVLNVGGFSCKNNMFLVDEFVSKEVIDELIKRGNKLLGGFINYSAF